MLLRLAADDRRLTADQLFYKFCHSFGFSAGIALDFLHYGAANDRGIGEFADRGELLGRRNSEADSNGLLCKFAQALNQFLRIFR